MNALDDALKKVSAVLAAAKSREAQAKSIAEIIRAARSYRWVGLYEVTEKEIGAISWTGTEAPVFPRFPASKGLCGAAVKTRAAVISNDVKNDPRYLTTFGSTQSEMIVPVFDRAKSVVGLIDVESEQRNAFSDADNHFLERCALLLAPLFA